MKIKIIQAEIKKYRNETGITRENLAIDMGLSKGCLQAIEFGKCTFLTKKTVSKITYFFPALAPHFLGYEMPTVNMAKRIQIQEKQEKQKINDKNIHIAIYLSYKKRGKILAMTPERMAAIEAEIKAKPNLWKL